MNSKNQDLTDQLTNASVRRLNESLERIEKCVADLTEDQVHLRSNKNTPSIGDLMAHLSGNIRQWVICSFTYTSDRRERDSEFNTDTSVQRSELLTELRNTISEASDVIEQLNKEALIKVYSVQGYEESGTDILVHVVEHLSYHTGQIALHTKLLLDKDLGFYAGQDLNSTRPTDQ